METTTYSVSCVRGDIATDVGTLRAARSVAWHAVTRGPHDVSWICAGGTRIEMHRRPVVPELPETDDDVYPGWGDQRAAWAAAEDKWRSERARARTKRT